MRAGYCDVGLARELRGGCGGAACGLCGCGAREAPGQRLKDLLVHALGFFLSKLMRMFPSLSMSLSLYLLMCLFWYLSRYSVMSLSKNLFVSLSSNISSL